MERGRLWVAGWLFGAWQVGYFLVLQVGVTASYLTYLAITLAWLLGVILGLRHARRWSGRGDKLWLLLANGTYGLTWLLVSWQPFNPDWLLLYGLFIIVTASYTGCFFHRAGKWVQPASRLFFWENNGFVWGLAFTPIAFIFGGRWVLWLSPLLLSVVIASAARQYTKKWRQSHD